MLCCIEPTPVGEQNLLDAIKYQHTLHTLRNQHKMIGVDHIVVCLLACHLYPQLRQDPCSHHSKIVVRQRFAQTFTGSLTPQHPSVLHIWRVVLAIKPSRWIEFVWLRKYFWVPLRHERRNADEYLDVPCENITSNVKLTTYVSRHKETINRCAFWWRYSWYTCYRWRMKAQSLIDDCTQDGKLEQF
jgi:hypothetical protein